FRLEPVPMAAAPVAALRAEMEARGLPLVELPSGAGHDAAILAGAGVPTAMLFVRSLNGGASHSPDEKSSDEDIALAVDVLAGAQAQAQGHLCEPKPAGSKVKTTCNELVTEAPQTCQVIESLVRDGNKIIFATSFGFQNCMVSEAKKHPDVKFEQATGTAQSKNLAEYFGAGEDAIYLSGMAAGAATKKGVIGYVVPFAIPEVIRQADAFALGARATDSGARVRLIWTNSWLDLGKEQKAAQSIV